MGEDGGQVVHDGAREAALVVLLLQRMRQLGGVGQLHLAQRRRQLPARALWWGEGVGSVSVSECVCV